MLSDMFESPPHRQSLFLRLFTEVEGPLRVFVRSLLPSPQDAADVMQEVAVVLWERFDTYDQTRSFRAWAFGVARFQALMFLRRARADRHVFDDELAHQIADTAMEYARQHDEQREVLDACLRRLEPGQRDLVLEAYAPGMRIDHLAQRRGRTAMALYKTLHRIRMILIACIRVHQTRGAAHE